MDNFVNKEEIFSQTELIRDFDKYTLNGPAFLLPSPTALPVDEDEFMVTFPIFMEMPTLFIDPDKK